MGFFSFLRSSPSEVSLLREELRLTRQQMEADRTAFQIQERRFKEASARLFPQVVPNPPDNSPVTLELKLRESWPGWFTPGAFGAIINPLAGYYDGITPLMSTVPTLWDYTLNLGFFVTEAWLDILRMYARTWYSVTPQAQGVMKGIRDYIIHTGFEYQCQPKKGARVRKSLPDQVQRVVDDFLSANHWYETEKDWFTRLHRDGEYMPRLFPQDSGVTQVRTVEPWQVRGGNTQPDNLFGVNTALGDREFTNSYRVTMSGSSADATDVGAFGATDEDGRPGLMTLVKINTDKQVRRGVSDFLATQELFRDLTTLLQNTQVGEALRQALVWVQETTGAANPLVEVGANGATPPAGYSFAPGATWGPGQIPTMDKNLQFKDGPKGNAASAQIAAQLAYQALSVYFRVPEWMISGTSAANFASSLTQESPLVRMAQAEQKFLKDQYARVVRKAIEIAELQEILEPGTSEKIDLNVEATPLVVRDAAGETQRNKTLHDDRLLSKRTWSTREELDRDHELENIEEEKIYDAAHPVPAVPGQEQTQESNYQLPSTDPAAQFSAQAPRPEDGNEGLAESVQDEQDDAESIALREEGFTGIDSHGHQWQNGKQVKRDKSKPAVKPTAGKPTAPNKGAKAPASASAGSPATATAEKGSGKSEKTSDPDANRPSTPKNRHKGARPKVLPWAAPPPPQGKKGGGALKTRPKGDQSQTKLGDQTEAVTEQLGLRNILPEGQRSHKPGENKTKGSTLDREYDHSGLGIEVKMCNVTASEYRAKPKPQEIADKLKYAEQNKLTPHTMLAIRDAENGKVHCYLSKKPGIVTKGLSEEHYDYVGTVELK